MCTYIYIIHMYVWGSQLNLLGFSKAGQRKSGLASVTESQADSFFNKHGFLSGMRYGKRKCFDLEILKAFKIADDSTILWDLECGQPAETAHTRFPWSGILELIAA